jgi:hypothetical protein
LAKTAFFFTFFSGINIMFMEKVVMPKRNSKQTSQKSEQRFVKENQTDYFSLF